MKIIVCLKQVPVQDSLLRIKEDSSWIHDTDLNYEINESDHYALEEALRLKEKQGGEVVVLSMGPERINEAIKQALAKGADRAIRICTDDVGVVDAVVNARMLAAAIKSESPDLILTGLQSDDFGFGQTGVILAEMLEVPHATIVVEVEPQEGKVKVKRELEAGWFQWVELPLPALLTIQSGINQIRYATIKGIMMAKKKEVKQVSPADLGLSEADISAGASGLKLNRIYVPEKTKQAQVLQGDAKDVARQLADKLKNEAKVF